MNILFLFAVYPENPNDTNLTKDLSDEFIKQGENVYVATIREKKLNLDTQVSNENGTNILRINTGSIFNNVTKYEKLYTMMSMNKTILKEIKRVWSDVKFDLIVGTTPYMANKTLIKGLQRQIYKENTNIPDKEEGYDHMNDALGYLIEYIKPLTLQAPFNIPQRWNVKKQRRYGIHQRTGTRYS